MNAPSADTQQGSELQRFLTLFDKLVGETVLWIEKTPEKFLDWTPPSDSGIHYGTRLRHASIKTLFVHMAVADNVWAKALRDCAPGDTIPLPRDMNFFHANLDGDFVKNTQILHAETMGIMAGLSPETLGKDVLFAGDKSTWTAMGFLWGIWGHRSYHLGNLDMLVRIRVGDAPDFFSFGGGQMA